MIPLHQIQIQRLCHANWETMSGDTQARFCKQCGKTVYNLSQMTAQTVQELLTQPNIKVCVRLNRTADGQIKTRDTHTPRKTLRKPKRPVQPTKAKPRTPPMPAMMGAWQ